MSLQQREWVVMVRPHWKRQEERRIVDSQLGQVRQDTGGDAPLEYWDAAIPMDSGVDTNLGCWVEWYRTRSYADLRREMRKLLKTIAREHVLISEEISVDTIISPNS